MEGLVFTMQLGTPHYSKKLSRRSGLAKPAWIYDQVTKKDLKWWIFCHNFELIFDEQTKKLDIWHSLENKDLNNSHEMI